jgi:hypothetical protein
VPERAIAERVWVQPLMITSSSNRPQAPWVRTEVTVRRPRPATSLLRLARTYRAPWHADRPRSGITKHGKTSWATTDCSTYQAADAKSRLLLRAASIIGIVPSPAAFLGKPRLSLVASCCDNQCRLVHPVGF